MNVFNNLDIPFKDNNELIVAYSSDVKYMS
jgi:hypothetical protein